MQLVYHEYGVLVNNKDAQHAESDWLTVQTAQKHDQLQYTLSIMPQAPSTP